METGSHETMFGAPGMASGVYLCRLSGKGFSETRKIILMR
jgi:hypothetical protein